MRTLSTMSNRFRISLVLLTSLVALVPATAMAVAARHIPEPGVLAQSRVTDAGELAQMSRAAPRWTFAGQVGFGSALVGSAPVGNGPSFTAVDPATHTIYVTNGFNQDGFPDLGDTVSVIDARHCQADDVSRCRGPWPTIKVGHEPSAIAIDQKTDTLYVSNSDDNTVSVFNGATCDAENTSGCGQTPATVPVGTLPVAIFADPADHTVYIPNGGEDDVSMLDSATCNASDLAACPNTPPPAVAVPGLATAGDMDPATHTAYVTICANNPSVGCGSGTDGVSVFDTNTCNAAVQAGCKRLGTLHDGNRPLVGDAVNAANHTLYTANGDDTISAYDLRRCNATDLAGCATDTPGTVTFPGPGFDVALWVAVDPALHTVYVTFQKDDSVIVVDAEACNGSHLARCAALSPPTIHTGADPEIITLDPHTQTLYTANQLDNNISVIDPARCDADTTSGCRHRVPEARIGSSGLAADPGVDTTYVAGGVNLASGGANTLSMINTNTCNALHTGGCSHTPPTVTVGVRPDAVAVDHATHTVYVADKGAGSTGTVTVLNDRACNATDQAGCPGTSTLNVPGGNPVDIAVNARTDTIYVATITSNGGPNLISVFNGATCNATISTGCAQTPSAVATGDDGGGQSRESVAVDRRTNTVYATSDTLGNPFVGDSVYVINGTTCDAANTSGCGQPPATVTLNPIPSNPFGFPGQQPNPFGIAVDQATDTIYTANNANGEGPGTVSVLNGATCNAQNTTGCSQTPATIPAGFGADGIAVDQLTNRAYATNGEDTSVTTINGNTCNGTNSGGCSHAQTQAIVGDYPGSISVDPSVGTAYIADFDGVSVFPLTPCLHGRCHRRPA